MGRINVAYAIFEGPSGPNKKVRQLMEVGKGLLATIACMNWPSLHCSILKKSCAPTQSSRLFPAHLRVGILAEGAIALSVTLSGGALFAS